MPRGFKDETDNIYERLKVIKRGDNSPNGIARWWCQCSCGNPELKLILGTSLRNGNTKSCGCLNKVRSSSDLEKRKKNHLKKIKKQKKVELIGEYFGDSTKTKYRCLIHDEIHLSTPTNVVQGHGLKCCKKAALEISSQKKKDDASKRYLKEIEGKFELLEDYDGKDNPILHFCLTHKESHKASPSQINGGKGLKCCGREKRKDYGKKRRKAAAKTYDAKIKIFGKVKRIGTYIACDIPILHECLIHHERHTTTPDSAIQGGGLMCCFTAGRKASIKKQKDDFLDKLITFCESPQSTVEYVEGFINSHKQANFKCKIHGLVLTGYPWNILNGSRLSCCTRGGTESIDQAINGELRLAKVESWIYLYHLKNYPDYVKFGITSNLKDRTSDKEFGDEICLWLMNSRLDAFVIEEALFYKTSFCADYPSELRGWEGYTEIRKYDPDLFLEIIQALVDRFYEVGIWQFVLDEIPLTSKQEDKVKILAREK